MLGDVLEWEKDRPDGAVDLVVMSAGSADVTREHDVRSMVLLNLGVGLET